MTIQPYDVRQTFGNSVKPILQNRSLEDYQGDLIRRFGIVPSWTELARLENKAMRAQLRINPGAAACIGKPVAKPDNYSRHEAAILDRLEDGEATARDIAYMLDLHLDTARDHLMRLRRSGRIVTSYLHQTHIYRLADQEAAE